MIIYIDMIDFFFRVNVQQQQSLNTAKIKYYTNKISNKYIYNYGNTTNSYAQFKNT